MKCLTAIMATLACTPAVGRDTLGMSLQYSKDGCDVMLSPSSESASLLLDFDKIVVVKNAKHVVMHCDARFAASTSRCRAVVPLDGSTGSALHVYGMRYAGHLQLIQTVDLPTAAPQCISAHNVPKSKGSSGPAIGLLYEGWQGYAANASAAVLAIGGTQIAVEQVIRSNGSLTLGDIWDKYPGVAELTQTFYWQETPVLGFYCTYRKRWNESVGVLPDCPNITATVTQQVAWFNQASVDFVTADATNLCTPSPFADAIQTRPFEVLLEEFSALRAQGVTTPSAVVWQRSQTGCTLWQQALNIYNNETFSPLIYRDPQSNKKVFFVPSDPDPSIVSQIESNGGRNDVLVQEMWALFDPSIYAQGRWAFESPCSTSKHGYTTSVVGLGRGATGCSQFVTTNSSLGTSISVSPSYQESYGSVPFSAAGKYEGLTFKRQFGTIFDNAAAAWEQAAEAIRTSDADVSVAAPSQESLARIRSMLTSSLPDNIYLSSWNEWISQPQPNPFKSPNYSFSMGIPWDVDFASSNTTGYTDRSALWVDTYGSSISRDIEPSVTHGTQLFDIMTSCLRVVTLMGWAQEALLPRVYADRADAAVEVYGAAFTERLLALRRIFGARPDSDVDPSMEGQLSLSSCAVQGEACCQYNETTDGYAIIFSLVNDAGSDSLVTTDPNEVAALTCAGCGWKQVCNGYGGGTDFCVDQGVLAGPEAMQGPFVLHSGGCAMISAQVFEYNPTFPPSQASVSLPDRAPLVRCYNGKNHFLTPDVTCGGNATQLEQHIGCLATSRTSNTPRGLRVCTNAANGHSYHMMDAPCEAGDVDSGILGYAH